MARLPRLAFAGQAHLVVQHGHRGQPVLVDDEDRSAFLLALGEVAAQERVALHGYSLTASEVRLLATPAVQNGLSRLMQALGRRYGARYNRRHGHTGTLWAGRFRACAVDPEGWLLRCLQYVERPDSTVSSAAHHLGRQRDALVAEHPAYWALGNTPFEREAAWLRVTEHALALDEAKMIEAAVRRGWPLGGDGFRAGLAEASERQLRPRARGRPSTHS